MDDSDTLITCKEYDLFIFRYDVKGSTVLIQEKGDQGHSIYNGPKVKYYRYLKLTTMRFFSSEKPQPYFYLK